MRAQPSRIDGLPDLPSHANSVLALREAATKLLEIADDPMTSTDDVLDYLDDGFRVALATPQVPPLLPAGAELHATLRLNYRGRYATCESTGDPRSAIQQLIEECSK